MTLFAKRRLRAVGLFLAAVAVSTVNAEQSPKVVNAIQSTGLPSIKENTKGKLSIENGNLHFTYREISSDVRATSIQDVVTGSDSQRAVGKTVGAISMAVPYGGGRIVSLFRKKIDTLTVEYRDADGALHGVIFTMPLGTADKIKKELLVGGAHTTAVAEEAEGAQASPSTSPKERKQ
jgi:hypothetical protein